MVMQTSPHLFQDRQMLRHLFRLNLLMARTKTIRQMDVADHLRTQELFPHRQTMDLHGLSGTLAVQSVVCARAAELFACTRFDSFMSGSRGGTPETRKLGMVTTRKFGQVTLTT